MYTRSFEEPEWPARELNMLNLADSEDEESPNRNGRRERASSADGHLGTHVAKYSAGTGLNNALLLMC